MTGTNICWEVILSATMIRVITNLGITIGVVPYQIDPDLPTAMGVGGMCSRCFFWNHNFLQYCQGPNKNNPEWLFLLAQNIFRFAYSCYWVPQYCLWDVTELNHMSILWHQISCIFWEEHLPLSIHINKTICVNKPSVFQVLKPS